MLGRSIEKGERTLIVGLSNEELIGGAVLALAFEELAGEVGLVHVGDGAPWAAPIAEYFAEQGRPVWVGPYEGVGDFDRVFAVGSALDREVPHEITEHPRARFALVGAGANAAELDATRAALMDRAAADEIRDVALIPRYQRVGRDLIELIEHVHHVVGPAGQSRLADTLRAALFGRHGRVPVSLGTREDPPHLDPITLMVFLLSL